MGTGTPSFGKKHTKSHTTCRRCGRVSFHIQHASCSSCGYPRAGMRKYNWAHKALRRRTEGTGRMRHLKTLPRRFKNGFREGTSVRARGRGEGARGGEGAAGLAAGRARGAARSRTRGSLLGPCSRLPAACCATIRLAPFLTSLAPSCFLPSFPQAPKRKATVAA